METNFNKYNVDVPIYDEDDRYSFEEIIEEFEEDDRDIEEALEIFEDYKNVIVLTNDEIFLFENIKKIYDFDGSSLFIENEKSEIYFYSEPREYDDLNELKQILSSFSIIDFNRIKNIYNQLDDCIIFITM